MKACKHCGDLFHATRAARKYCGQACYQAAMRQRRESPWRNGSGEKRCSRCDTWRDRGDFYSSRDGDSHDSWCRQCRREDERGRRRNPALIASYHDRYENDMRFRARVLLKACEKRCKRGGVEYDLDVDWLATRLESGRCEVTGLRFNCSVKTRRRNLFTPSIDRVVAGGGYTKDNCRVVLFAVNTAISDWGLEAFLPIAEALVARHRRKDVA